MSKKIRVTNLFTGNSATYDDIEALRRGEREACDASLAGTVDMLADAYAKGHFIGTYTWLIGVRVDEVDE